MLKNSWFQIYKKFEKAEREYKQYVGQFFSTGWGNEYIVHPAKILNWKEIEIIKEKRLRVNKLKQRYQEVRSAYWMLPAPGEFNSQ